MYLTRKKGLHCPPKSKGAIIQTWGIGTTFSSHLKHINRSYHGKGKQTSKSNSEDQHMHDLDFLSSNRVQDIFTSIRCTLISECKPYIEEKDTNLHSKKLM
jgi:hypothetical protein